MGDTLAAVLFHPLGDIAVYSVPSLSRRSIARSVTRASSLTSWRGDHVVTHAVRDSGIVVSADGRDLDGHSPTLFSGYFQSVPRAMNLFGRVGVREHGSASLASFASPRDLLLVVFRRDGAQVRGAALVQTWCARVAFHSRSVASSPLQGRRSHGRVRSTANQGSVVWRVSPSLHAPMRVNLLPSTMHSSRRRSRSRSTRARPMHPQTRVRCGRACCRAVDAVPRLRRRQSSRSFGIADDVPA